MRNLDNFIKITKKGLKKRLVALIGYGSFFIKKYHADSDIDLVFILSSRKTKDMQIIRNSILSAKLVYPVNPLIIYKNQLLSDGLFFSANTCGPFFLDVLCNGKVLFGKNILKEITGPGVLAADISLLQKIQQYNHQLKLFYLNLRSDEQFSKYDQKLYTKRIQLMLKNVMSLSKKKDSEILKADKIKFINTISKSKLSTPKEVLVLIQLADTLYTSALQHCKKKYGLSFI